MIKKKQTIWNIDIKATHFFYNKETHMISIELKCIQVALVIWG